MAGEMSTVVSCSEEALILKAWAAFLSAWEVAELLCLHDCQGSDSIHALTLCNAPTFPFRHLVEPKIPAGTKFRLTSMAALPKHNSARTF